MRIRIVPVLLALVALIFSACQKEIDNQPGRDDKLSGTWQLLSMKGNVRTTTLIGLGADQEKGVNFYSFDGEDVTGTITFDAPNLRTNEMGYTVHSTLYSEYYNGGSLIVSFDAPLDVVIPKSSAVTTYEVIGSDSISLKSGVLTFDPANGGTGTGQATIPQGFKYRWENDILVMESVMTYSMVQTVNGENLLLSFNGTQLMRLKKK